MEEEKQVLQNEVTTNAPKEKKNHTAIIALIILVLVSAIGYRGYYFYKKLQVSDPIKITTNKIKALANSSKEVLSGSDFYSKDKTTKMTVDGKIGDYKFNVETAFDLKNSIGEMLTTVDEKGKNLLYLDGRVTATDMFIQVAKDSNIYKGSDDFSELFKTLVDYSGMINNNYAERITKYFAESFEATFTKDDFEKTKEKITVFDKEMEATKYETVIDEKDLVKMMSAFIDKLVNDDEFLSATADFSKAMGEEVTKAELKESLIEAKKELATAEPEEIKIKYTIYVKGADVVRLALNIPDVGKISYDTYKKDIAIKIDTEDSKVEITYNEKSNEYAVKMNNVAFVTGTYKETIKKNDVSVNITFDVPLLMMSGEVNSRVYVTDKAEEKTYKDALDLNDPINANKLMDELSKNEFFTQLSKSLSGMFFNSSVDGIEF